MISPERFPRIETSADLATTRHGFTVTASATIHTKGAWTSLIAATDFHAYLCCVIVGETGVTNTDTSMLVDIGVDPAGGTAYTVEIPNILAGHTPLSTQALWNVWFPVSFPKGSQVAARCQALIVSDTAIVGVILIGGKNRSNAFPHRSIIQDYGTSTAASGGTAMANAAANVKGAWTQLGADTTRRHSGLVLAAQGADAALNAARYLVDVGVDPAGGTAYTVIIPDIPLIQTSTELNIAVDPMAAALSLDIPAGSSIAARASCSTANGQTNLEVAVYGF